MKRIKRQRAVSLMHCEMDKMPHQTIFTDRGKSESQIQLSSFHHFDFVFNLTLLSAINVDFNSVFIFFRRVIRICCGIIVSFAAFYEYVFLVMYLFLNLNFLKKFLQMTNNKAFK